MRVDILTLFPNYFKSILETSILKRAVDGGKLNVIIRDLRRFAHDQHHLADDYRFGGGAGMLIKPEPCFEAIKSILPESGPRPLVIYPSPQGKKFMHADAVELSREGWLVFLCGHYKGVDHRVIERWVDREYSLGDYIITGGEPAVAVMVDACVRLIPDVLGDLDSARTDSFIDGRLDGPHYTRPKVIDGMAVPAVLRSGNHSNIERWRQITARLLTRHRRPDLISK